MNKSMNMSLPQEREARGYTIKKAPLGAYLAAIEQLNDFPAQLTKALFPNMGLTEIFGLLKNCDSEMLGDVLVRLLGIAPEMALTLLAKLTGIPESKLKNDPNIGADGLVEIVNAWMEVNNIENFTRAASKLLQKVKALAVGSRTSGSNA